MARLLAQNGVAFTSPQRRLLGGWRDVLDDIRDLAAHLEAMPDQCRCTSGGSHPDLACECCSGATRRLPCAECEARIAACTTDVETLMLDTLRFFPAFSHILAVGHPASAHAVAGDVQHEIGALIRTFEQVRIGVEAYSTGCRASHLPTIRFAARELHDRAERLERIL